MNYLETLIHTSTPETAFGIGGIYGVVTTLLCLFLMKFVNKYIYIK